MDNKRNRCSGYNCVNTVVHVGGVCTECQVRDSIDVINHLSASCNEMLMSGVWSLQDSVDFLNDAVECIDPTW